MKKPFIVILPVPGLWGPVPGLWGPVPGLWGNPERPKDFGTAVVPSEARNLVWVLTNRIGIPSFKFLEPKA